MSIHINYLYLYFLLLKQQYFPSKATSLAPLSNLSHNKLGGNYYQKQKHCQSVLPRLYSRLLHFSLKQPKTYDGRNGYFL